MRKCQYYWDIFDSWQNDKDAGTTREDGRILETRQFYIPTHFNPFALLPEVQDDSYSRHRIIRSLTNLGLYPSLRSQPRWTQSLLSVQHTHLKMGYKRQTKKRRTLMRGIKQHYIRLNELDDTLTPYVLRQHVTRINQQVSSIIIPNSPIPTMRHDEDENTLTIHLVFPGKQLPNQDITLPHTLTVHELSLRITQLFDSTIIHTIMYLRPNGRAWTRFYRVGTITDSFLPGEPRIPCASIQHGSILRIEPYFYTCSDDEHDELVTSEGRNEDEHETYLSDDSSTSESSLAIHQRSYIRPECGESSAESAERHREIDTRRIHNGCDTSTQDDPSHSHHCY